MPPPDFFERVQDASKACLHQQMVQANRPMVLQFPQQVQNQWLHQLLKVIVAHLLESGIVILSILNISMQVGYKEQNPYKISISKITKEPFSSFNSRPVPSLPNHISWDEQSAPKPQL